MTYIIRTFVIAVFVSMFLSAGSLSMAGDLDDGISKFKDDSIKDDSKMGDPDPNISGLGLNTSDFKKLMESSEHQYQRAKATLAPPESIAPPR